METPNKEEEELKIQQISKITIFNLQTKQQILQ